MAPEQTERLRPGNSPVSWPRYAPSATAQRQARSIAVARRCVALRCIVLCCIVLCCIALCCRFDLTWTRRCERLHQQNRRMRAGSTHIVRASRGASEQTSKFARIRADGRMDRQPPPVHWSVGASVHLTDPPTDRPSVTLSVHPPVRLFMHPFVRASVCLRNQPSAPAFVRRPVRLCIGAAVCPSRCVHWHVCCVCAVCAHVCTCTHICARVHVCMRAFLRVHVRVCIHGCVTRAHVRARRGSAGCRFDVPLATSLISICTTVNEWLGPKQGPTRRPQSLSVVCPTACPSDCIASCSIAGSRMPDPDLVAHAEYSRSAVHAGCLYKSPGTCLDTCLGTFLYVYLNSCPLYKCVWTCP